MTARTRRRLGLQRLETRDAPSISPIGAEFRANAFTGGAQRDAAMAMDADGDFVVAWTSVDGDGDGVRARRFNSVGVAHGNEFYGNVYSTGAQTNPAVAANAAGDFVVVWQSDGQDGSGTGVYGRRFSANGEPRGFEFRVNQTTAGNQDTPSVATDFAGNFVVAWQSSDGNGLGIYARRYDAAGTALGGEFLVNTFFNMAGDQHRASVGMSYTGSFVVAWESAAGTDIYTRMFSADGTALTNALSVNFSHDTANARPAVALDPDGNITIAWQQIESGSPTETGWDIVARRYTVNGGFLPGLITIAGTEADETDVTLARDARGNTIVAWTLDREVLFFHEIDVAYCVVAGGTPSASQFVNTFRLGVQSTPAVACDVDGDFVVAWTGHGDGDDAGIFAQRYDQTNDFVAPDITGVYAAGGTDPITEGGRLIPPPTGLVVAFSEPMSISGGPSGSHSVTNPSNWQLTRNGVVVPLATVPFGLNSATNRFETIVNPAEPLVAGSYVLTPSASLMDWHDNALGGFSRRFTVGIPVAAGPETPVNQVTAGDQSDVSVASDAAGNYVTVWCSDDQDGDGRGVYARRYGINGLPLGNEFRVNDFTTGDQQQPDVAMDADGDFVVVWQSHGQSNADVDVHARRYNRFGVAQGPEFLVDQTSPDRQDRPAVALDALGNFVVTWESHDGNAQGIFARRFAADGVALGNEFRVNAWLPLDQLSPDVAADGDGDFVVVWADYRSGDGADVYARMFDAYGVARSDPFRVNVYATSSQTNPTVAMDADGDFVVAWQSENQDSFASGIFARRYDVTGVAMTGDIAVNVTTAGDQVTPSVTLDADGDVLVAWSSTGQDGSLHGVYARRFNAAGNPFGNEFGVNTFTGNDQVFPVVAVDAEGDAVIAWASDGQDGAGNGVYLQRYSAAAPRVASVVVNAEQANAVQRSRVTSITVTFDSVVTFAGPVAEAFGLSRIGGGAVGGFTATAAAVGGVTVVTLSGFNGTETEFGSLADGRYAVTVRANRVTAVGQQLDGDGNGLGGDDFTLEGTAANGLYRLFGDATGDGVVSATDFARFRPAYGTAMGQAGYLEFLDFNNDGIINAIDFAQFRNRYGLAVP